MAKRRTSSPSTPNAATPRVQREATEPNKVALTSSAKRAPQPSLEEVTREDVAPQASPRAELPRWAIRALWAMIVVGVLCRFVGLNWDEGTHLHPDERFLADTVPKLNWPHSWSEYFETARAPLNPFNHISGLFVYGQLPLLFVKGLAATLNRDNYDGVLLVGRASSALFGALSALLMVAIGRRVLGNMGLIAAALLACSALDIQQAHFFVVDTFAAFWMVAAFWAALKVGDANAKPWKWAALCGLFWGAAMACKVSSALFGVVLLPFLFAELFGFNSSRHTTMKSALLASGLALFCALGAFRVGHPMAFRGESSVFTLGGLLDVRKPMASVKADGAPGKTFFDSLSEQADITAGRADPPWNLQWIGRRNFAFPARQLWSWGLGPAFALCAVLGALGSVLLGLQRRKNAQKETHAGGVAASPAVLAAAAWMLISFGFYGGQYSKFSRYYLVLTPFAALCAAWLLDALWQRLSTRETRVARNMTPVLIGIVPVLTALWALAVTSIYTRPHTRIAASRWILTNIAPGTVIANESGWDDALPWRGASIPPSQLNAISLELYDPDTPEKRATLLAKLDQAQWIFVSSGRVWGSIPRLPMKWPMTTVYYRALFDGSLGFRAAKQFTSYPQLNLGPLHARFPDDFAEEGLTVYDHPRVMLFEKTSAYSHESAASLLNPNLLTQRREVPLTDLIASGYHPDEAALPKLPALKDGDSF